MSAVREQDLINAFDACVELMADGMRMEDCLQRYPQHAAELRDMLALSEIVRRVQAVPAEAEPARLRNRARFNEAINANLGEAPRKRKPVQRSWLPLVAILTLTLVSGIGMGVLGASFNAGSTIQPLSQELIATEPQLIVPSSTPLESNGLAVPGQPDGAAATEADSTVSELPPTSTPLVVAQMPTVAPSTLQAVPAQGGSVLQPATPAEVTTGQLPPGILDDNASYAEFLLEFATLPESTRQQVNLQDRRLLQVQDGTASPLPGALLEVRAGDMLLSRSLTDVRGEDAFFPYLVDGSAISPDTVLTLSVAYGDASLQYGPVPLSIVPQTLMLSLPDARLATLEANVDVLVLVAGGDSSLLQPLRSDWLERVTWPAWADVRYALVSAGSDAAALDFSSSPRTISTAFSVAQPGDSAAVASTLTSAIDAFSWREDALKYVLLLLDPSDQSTAIPAARAAAEAGLRLIVVSAPGADDNQTLVMRALAMITMGRFAALDAPGRLPLVVTGVMNEVVRADLAVLPTSSIVREGAIGSVIAPLPTPVVSEILIAEQPFEGGRMIWLEPVNQIWVLLDDGRWLTFNDSFVEGEPESDPSITPPSDDLFQPTRGFGKLWRSDETLRDALGWATAPETGYVTRYTYNAGGAMVDGVFEAAPGEHVIETQTGLSLRFDEAEQSWQ